MRRSRIRTIVDDLGLTEIERELVSIDPGYRGSFADFATRFVSYTVCLQLCRTQRRESGGNRLRRCCLRHLFVTAGDERVCSRLQRATTVRQALHARRSAQFVRGISRSKTRSVRLTSRLSILPDVPTVKEFELFKEFFEQSGYPSVICTPQELEFGNNRLSVSGQEIDIVYKRLLVNEYLPIMREYPALLDAYRAGAICMVNSFRSKLIHKKALFAVLTDPRHAALFSDK